MHTRVTDKVAIQWWKVTCSAWILVTLWALAFKALHSQTLEGAQGRFLRGRRSLASYRCSTAGAVLSRVCSGRICSDGWTSSIRLVSENTGCQLTYLLNLNQIGFQGWRGIAGGRMVDTFARQTARSWPDERRYGLLSAGSWLERGGARLGAFVVLAARLVFR